jgi:uncharacterized HhH-GPD family protein
MLLDQQIPIIWAFGGPARLRERLGHLEPALIAGMDPESFVEVACTKPAIHRYPAVMAARVQELCTAITERYEGDVSQIWMGGANARAVKQSLLDLPGYGEEKAKILIAILAKRFDIKPSGWKRECEPFGDNQPRSVADIGSKTSLNRVKEWKAAQRAAGKSKQD